MGTKMKRTQNESGLNLDTTKDGQLAIWKIYQHAAIDELLNHEELNCRQVWDMVRNRGIEISRTSVIFFLNDLVNAGLATYRTTTGKGGIHRVYALVDRTWADFNNTVIDKFLYKLWEIFPENERIAKAVKC